MTEWNRTRDLGVVYLEKLPGTGVARIVLNRPEKRNAMSPELMSAFLEALEELRGDDDISVVISCGNGPTYSAGQDLHALRASEGAAAPDWDRPYLSTRLYESVRLYPKIMVAQIHGYCLGGAVALINSHDLVVAADDVQIGMPEIIRGSFGMNVTATLFHSNIPIKKAALLQLSGRNITGREADGLGLVSMAVPADDVESTTVDLAVELASRHPQALRHAKIAVELGRDLPLKHAMEVDRLVTTRMQTAVDPLNDVSGYLESQKGGTNGTYVRPDVPAGA